jgi:hypothetical protein
MDCSALLRHGIAHIATLERELANWLESHGYESISQLQGCMSELKCSDPSAFEAPSTFAPLLDHVDGGRHDRAVLFIGSWSSLSVATSASAALG